MNRISYRVIVVGGGVVLGMGYIALLSVILQAGIMAELLLDRNTRFFPYPFTIQNLSWIIFFGGCGELFVRIQRATVEDNQLKKKLLPEDDSTMLRSEDLGEYYAAANTNPRVQNCFLQRLISRTILQFQSSRSVNQANTLMNSSLELFQHEVDLNYHMLRYVVWLIPTLGFIGTVVGIALALNETGASLSSGSSGVSMTQNPELLVAMTKNLGVAFYTTLLALLLSAVLVFVLHVAQAREERALNKAGQYCLDNLINRLYEK